jgi:hypothetical protein
MKSLEWSDCQNEICGVGV